MEKEKKKLQQLIKECNMYGEDNFFYEVLAQERIFIVDVIKFINEKQNMTLSLTTVNELQICNLIDKLGEDISKKYWDEKIRLGFMKLQFCIIGFKCDKNKLEDTIKSLEAKGYKSPLTSNENENLKENKTSLLGNIH